MNDFTKEELIALKLCIEDENLQGWTAMDYERLCRKLESMIENYCEHQSDGKNYCPGLYDKVCSGGEILAVDLNRVKKCVKCYRYFE